MKTVKPLDCKAGSSGIERPLFSPGLLLEDEDLTAGVNYTRELSRLLFRSLFGCGVICGLEVKGELFCKRQQLRVTVGPGLALDGAGNPMQVTKSVPLATQAGLRSAAGDRVGGRSATRTSAAARARSRARPTRTARA